MASFSEQLLVSASVKGSSIKLVKTYDITSLHSGEELEVRVLHDLRELGAKLRQPTRSRPQGLTLKSAFGAVFTPAAVCLHSAAAEHWAGGDATTLLLLRNGKLLGVRKSFPHDVADHFHLPGSSASVSCLPLDGLRAVAAKQRHDRNRAARAVAAAATANSSGSACISSSPYRCGSSNPSSSFASLLNASTASAASVAATSVAAISTGAVSADSLRGATAATAGGAVEPLEVTVWQHDTVYELEVRTGAGRLVVPRLRRSATVRELKARVQALGGFPAGEQTYEWRGTVLPDATRLCDAHVTDWIALRMAPLPPQRGGGPRFELVVRSLGGGVLTLPDVWGGTTVQEVKARIQQKEGIPPEQQRLLVSGVAMEDPTRNLADYRVDGESCASLQLLLRPRHGGLLHATGGWQAYAGASAEAAVAMEAHAQTVRVLLPGGGTLELCSEEGEGAAGFEARLRRAARRAAAGERKQRRREERAALATPVGESRAESASVAPRSKRLRGEAPDGEEGGVPGTRRPAGRRLGGTGGERPSKRRA